MTLVVVFGVIVAVIGVLLGALMFAEKKDLGRWEFYPGSFFFWSGIGVVLGIVVAFGGSFIANTAMGHHDHYKTVGLAALRDGITQNSSYVFGTGSSDSQPSYTFYWSDRGANHLEKVDASSVSIFEDAPAHPYAVRFTGCELTHRWISGCVHNGGSFVALHVPPGSVVRRFDLSLNH